MPRESGNIAVPIGMRLERGLVNALLEGPLSEGKPETFA